MTKYELRELIREEIRRVIKEAQLDSVNQKLKDEYIDHYLSYIYDIYHGDWDDNVPSIEKIEAHAKKYGYTDTLRTIDQKETKIKQMFGGQDKLATKAPGSNVSNLTMRDPLKHLTKKGKMDKRDIDRLKIKIRQNLGI